METLAHFRRQVLETGEVLTTGQAEIHNLRGLDHCRSKKYTAAISSYTRAIHLNPHEPSYYFHRAEAYLQLTEFSLAIANFLKVSETVLEKQVKRTVINGKKVDSFKLKKNDDILEKLRFVVAKAVSQEIRKAEERERQEILMESTKDSMSKSSSNLIDKSIIELDQTASEAGSRNLNVDLVEAEPRNSDEEPIKDLVKNIEDSMKNENVEADKDANNCNEGIGPFDDELVIKADTVSLKQKGSSSYSFIRSRLSQVYFLYAQILMDQQRFQDAIIQLKLAGTFGFEIKKVDLKKACAYVGLGDYSEVIRIINKLICEEALNADLLIFRAKIYVLQDNFELANLDLRLLKELNSNNVEVQPILEYITRKAVDFKNNAAKFVTMGERPLAIRCLGKAIELDEDDWVSWFKRAILNCEAGKYENAISDMKVAMGCSMRDTTRDNEMKMYLAHVYNMNGVQKFQEQDYSTAYFLFTEAVHYESYESSIRKNRGDCCFMLRTLDQALEEYLSGLKLAPNDEDLLKSCALVHYEKGNKLYLNTAYRSAITQLTQSLKYYQTAQTHFLRSRAYSFLGQLDKSRVDLEACLNLDPHFTHAEAMLRELTMPIHTFQPHTPSLKEYRPGRVPKKSIMHRYATLGHFSEINCVLPPLPAGKVLKKLPTRTSRFEDLGGSTGSIYLDATASPSLPLIGSTENGEQL